MDGLQEIRIYEQKLDFMEIFLLSEFVYKSTQNLKIESKYFLVGEKTPILPVTYYDLDFQFLFGFRPYIILKFSESA